MIARTWHGKVPKNKSEEYFSYLRNTGVKDCQKIEGNKGVFVFRNTEAEYTHFLLYSFWDSYDSIRKFAGDEIEKARYYALDNEYLLELEPNVKHYEVFSFSKKL